MIKAFPRYFKYIVLFTLISLPIFAHLEHLTIRLWDESRLALNAYEMLKNGNPIVTYFEGKPDMWNTKPPLMIWMQVLFMKILGVNELAVRLPSAIAAFLTCMALLLFSVKFLKNFWFGFIAVLVLVTTNGYIDNHAARTGDYDAMLALFTTLYALFFFIYSETKKTKYLYFFYISVTLAVLTKGISGCFFLPAIAIYVFIVQDIMNLVRNKHIYFGLLATISICLGYYGLREILNPGYLNAVWENELGGRYFSVVEKHKQPFSFYYDGLINTYFSYWHLMVPGGIIVGLFFKNKRFKSMAIFSSIMACFYFFLISFAQTKLEWYLVPLYPFLSLIVALFLFFIMDLIRNSERIYLPFQSKITPVIFVSLVGIEPYSEIIDKTNKPKEIFYHKLSYNISYYLRDAVKGKYDVNGYYVVVDDYSPQHTFYLNILNDQGVKISYKKMEELTISDKLIANHPEVLIEIEQSFQLDTLKKYRNVKLLKIKDLKNQ